MVEGHTLLGAWLWGSLGQIWRQERLSLLNLLNATPLPTEEMGSLRVG